MIRRLLVALCGLLLTGAAHAQGAPDLTAWWRGYEAAGAATTPDGRKLRLYCLGAGSPTVVFEAGLGGPGGASFRTVQPQVAAVTRACVYDRAGYGRSAEAHDDRDLAALAGDLGTVVEAAGGGRPVVLVGHSFGGPIVRYFAYTHRRLAAGLVLIDPSGDDQVRRFAAAVPRLAELPANDAALHHRCVSALAKGPIEDGSPDYRACVDLGPGDPWPPADAPADLEAALVGERGDAFQRAVMAEDAAFEGSDRDAREAAAAKRPLGDLPLIVLTRGKTVELPGLTPREAVALTGVWRRMHWEMSTLSSDGRRVFVEGAGHRIQADRPQAVVEAVERVVAEARARAKAR
jgi:pimeloyl-ACP methyl ester carboxylesterase